MILVAKDIQTEVYQLAVVPCCSLGLEGKEAAPPTNLRGELRKEKLITGAEHWPSHQTQHFCILKNLPCDFL